MTRSFTQVTTKNARLFMDEFASEWRQGVPPVSTREGRLAVPSELGMSEMRVEGDVLKISITAPSISNAAYLEAAVSEFLDRAAGDEELQYRWTMQPEAFDRRNVPISSDKFSWSEIALAQG